MPVTLFPHQNKAVREMHNGCILAGDVGSGKTITSLAYFYLKVAGGVPNTPGGESRPMESPMDIYVITTAKKRDSLDWEREASHFGISREPNADGVKLHVDSWQNIADYEHVTDAFFIFDEQRLVGNGAWVKAFYKIADQNQWIMLSATPGDNWMDYIPVFVANGYFKNRTEFIRNHVVYNTFTKFPKVDRYVGTGKLNHLRREVLVEMPYERHTSRNQKMLFVDYDKEKFELATKHRWNPFEDRPIKDISELFIVMRKIVNSDPSRLGAVMEVLENTPRLIIFYNFNYELEALRTLAKNLNYPVAEWNGHKHEDIPDTDLWMYLVQYTAGAEGWNCVTTDSILFYSLNYSFKIFEQAKGRIDRLNTPYEQLYYYVVRSASAIDQAIWSSLMSKQTFNQSAWARNTFGDIFKKEEDSK